MILVAAWLRAFLITATMEALFAFFLLGRKRPVPRRLGAILVGQLATHPIVWFVWPELGMSRPLYLLVAELWAFSIELAVYRLVFSDLPLARAAAVSALANGSSLVAGLLLRE